MRYRPLVCLAALFTAPVLHAGDLNPPVGPVAPTLKDLRSVEPRTEINQTNTPGDADSLFKISAPGSYYLASNITGVAGKHGIEIASAGVAIDLMGFDLVGVAGMGNFDGVRNTLSAAANIVVVNGSIRNWGGDGVDLISNAALNGRIEAVVASGNAGAGIRGGNGGTITGCAAYLNTGNGITSGGDCVLARCHAQSNAIGISAGSGSVVVECVAYLNAAQGIIVGIGSLVADCAAQSNASDGILCGNESVIRGNVCAINGNGGTGAGIRTIGTRSRIESNTCTEADVGIDIDGTANIIIRNTCGANTVNWTIAAGNALAPIVAATTNAAAVSGNSYTGSLGSTDPNANFTY